MKLRAVMPGAFAVLSATCVPFRTCFFNTRANLISVSVSDKYGRSASAGLYVRASLNLADIIIAGVIVLIIFLVFKAVTSWYPRYLPY